MYDDTISKMNTIRAYDKILSDLQVQQSERDRINALLQLQLQCTNVFNPLPPCKEEVEVEDVQKPKTPFEIRVELWSAVNEEIAQVEDFLKNLTLKRPWITKFFNVRCYMKNRTGFTVDTGTRMELPAALQEKMIRAAEEYLEDLKKQRKDMEQGYE